MAFQRLCAVDDVWEGEMTEHDVDGHEILLLGVEGGEVKAFQARCPHQDVRLVEGEFDGRRLICRAHRWEFDACSGRGINPDDCRLAEYPIRVENGQVMVETEDVWPMYGHT